MNGRACEREPEVLSGLKRGLLSRELQEHLSGCDACADLVLVESSLRREGRRALAEARFPDSSLIWRRARLEGRRDKLRQALWPIDLVRWVAAAAAAVLLLATGARHLPWMIASLAERVVPWLQLAEVGRPQGWPLVLAAGALALALLLFDLYGRWADEPL